MGFGILGEGQGTSNFDWFPGTYFRDAVCTTRSMVDALRPDAGAKSRLRLGSVVYMDEEAWQEHGLLYMHSVFRMGWHGMAWHGEQAKKGLEGSLCRCSSS